MGSPPTQRLLAAGAVLAALALLASLAMLMGGCNALLPRSKIAGHVDAPAPLSGTGAGFQVGAARVDLTPIPGIPMSYSFDGKVSRGFWTRLYARAIYLEDEHRNAIVLVACEVAAIPNGLRDRVAELVRNEAPTKHLGRAQIVLAATHTHQGPQNFFSSEYYNSLPSQRAGFDPQLFEFLAERIKTAILDAFANRKPDSAMSYREGKLQLFFRNRSISAFRLNAEQE
jgi:neutral ceramidase